MTIYVDEVRTYPAAAIKDPRVRRVSRQWCHLVAGGNDLESLHAFAFRIGCQRSWFQDRPGFPHYDLTAEHRDVALREGAVDIRLRDLIRMMRGNESAL